MHGRADMRVKIDKELQEALRTPLIHYDVSTNTLPLSVLEDIRSKIEYHLYEHDETVAGRFDEDVPF